MNEEMKQRDTIFGASPDLREIVSLHVAEIQPDPEQPRLTMDEQALEELAHSIREHGLLNPITVRKNLGGEGYIVVAGARRFEAHRRLNQERIEAIILRDADAKKIYEIQLIENLQREDLSPFEEATGFARMIEEFGYTQEQVAERMGKQRTDVSRTLTLNQLPEKIKVEARNAPFRKTLLWEVANQPSEQAQLDLWQRAKRGATVRELREAAATNKTTKKPLSVSQQRRKLEDTVKVGNSFAAEFGKKLRQIEVAYLSANKKEVKDLHGLLAKLEAVANELRGKLEEVDAAPSQTRPQPDAGQVAAE